MNTKDQAIAPKNEGHGHVWARPDGVKARCGGPRMCSVCAIDLAQSIVSQAESASKAAAPTLIAEVQGEIIGHLAPDCRTCENFKHYQHCNHNHNSEVDCTNGDQYQPAPRVVLWMTE